MRLSIPTNWDDRVVALVHEINQSCAFEHKVGQVYGAGLTAIGAGRMDTPQVDEEVMRSHIRQLRDIGVPFNFIINAPSLGGREHDRRYRGEILATLDWIQGLGAEIVTVSIPFLGELINAHFPELHVKLSTILDVRSVHGIRLLEGIGPKIHSITVSRFINRDLALIEQMVAAAPFGIELLANSMCLLDCPYQKYHGDLVCWFAKLERGWDEPFRDYRSLGCEKTRLESPVELIKAPWIRPEDLGTYARLGVESVKLAGRTFATDDLTTVVEAYAHGQFEGNLWKLIAPHLPVRVDNRSLDGFLRHFTEGPFPCREGCNCCGYCAEAASRSVELLAGAGMYLEDLELRLRARLDETLVPVPRFKQSIL